ncbi:hypothetical protein E2C01_100563 [Portunus trituberculatus]|uniref:Uncharacterized protein n=1 Tax=Portunus trituberculatus TaxID=210409 RepID=A0A5B7K3G2_PORTR|nr:hypothetical protein [Portunus trituberculatus]
MARHSSHNIHVPKLKTCRFIQQALRCRCFCGGVRRGGRRMSHQALQDHFMLTAPGGWRPSVAGVSHHHHHHHSLGAAAGTPPSLRV